MTDRIHGLYVALNRDIRDDDMEYVINAIKMIKHVSNVKTKVVNMDDYLARSRVMNHVQEEVFKMLQRLRDSDFTKEP